MRQRKETIAANFQMWRWVKRKWNLRRYEGIYEPQAQSELFLMFWNVHIALIFVQWNFVRQAFIESNE
jgi:hypothetical protein